MALIGIVVDEQGIEGVLVRGMRGAPLWSHATPCERSSLNESLAGVLRAIPRGVRGVRGARVRIAVGASWCQLRHLRELPHLKDSVMRSAIAQGVARFFLRGPTPLVTTGVAWTSETSGWCAAFELSFVQMLADVCQAHGVTLDLIASLGALKAPDQKSLPRACAVARLQRTASLAYAPLPQRRLATSRELVVIATVLLVTALVSVTAPGITAALSAWHAERELKRLRVVASPVVEDERALRELQLRARAMARFARGARSHALLIGHLATSLPEHAFLVTLKTDTSGGTATIISSSVDDALRAMRSIPGVADAQIQGATTREDLPGESRQRVTVRFTWAPTPASVVSADQVAAR